LGLPITLMGAVIGTLVFQRVAADENAENRIANTNHVVRVLIPVAALAAAGLGLVAQWLVPALYGSAFSAASTALILLLPGFFALAIETVVMNFLAGDGSPPIVYLAPLTGLVINLGANLFVIPRWGINGAAVTSSVGYIVVFLITLAFYSRWTKSGLSDVILVRRSDLNTASRRGPDLEAPTAPEARPA
jgi:O-antigen/teichoic acid export membrane protein